MHKDTGTVMLMGNIVCKTGKLETSSNPRECLNTGYIFTKWTAK